MSVPLSQRIPLTPSVPKGVRRLDQLMLSGTVTMVIAIIILSGGLQVIATLKEFEQSTAQQRDRLVAEAHESSRAAALLLATTSAQALRDNDFGFLADLVGP